MYQNWSWGSKRLMKVINEARKCRRTAIQGNKTDNCVTYFHPFISLFMSSSGCRYFLSRICRSAACVLSVLARELSFRPHKPPLERSAIIYPAEDESAATTCSTECPQEFTQQRQKMSVHSEHDDKVLLRGFSATSVWFTGIGGERAASQKTTRQIMNQEKLTRWLLAWVCDRETKV